MLLFTVCKLWPSHVWARPPCPSARARDFGVRIIITHQLGLFLLHRPPPNQSALGGDFCVKIILLEKFCSVCVKVGDK